MNKAEKSLRWVVNQIPDFKPTTNEEKMLVAIKLYSEAGAEEIKRLESENAALRVRLDKAVELPCKVGDTVYLIRQAILKKPYKLEIEETKIEKVILTKTGWKVKFESNSFYETSIKNFNKTWFTDKSEAEARLAELKGGRE